MLMVQMLSLCRTTCQGKKHVNMTERERKYLSLPHRACGCMCAGEAGSQAGAAQERARPGQGAGRQCGSHAAAGAAAAGRQPAAAAADAVHRHRSGLALPCSATLSAGGGSGIMPYLNTHPAATLACLLSGQCGSSLHCRPISTQCCASETHKNLYSSAVSRH